MRMFISNIWSLKRKIKTEFRRIPELLVANISGNFPLRNKDEDIFLISMKNCVGNLLKSRCQESQEIAENEAAIALLDIQ